jgi:hypothetical protein
MTAIERLARNLCSRGGHCESCNANIGFECIPKQTAKKVTELGYCPIAEGTWVGTPYSTDAGGDMIRDLCPFCGNRSKDVGNFCSHCGARLRRL